MSCTKLLPTILFVSELFGMKYGNKIKNFGKIRTTHFKNCVINIHIENFKKISLFIA